MSVYAKIALYQLDQGKTEGQVKAFLMDEYGLSLEIINKLFKGE